MMGDQLKNHLRKKNKKQTKNSMTADSYAICAAPLFAVTMQNISDVAEMCHGRTCQAS